MIDFLRQSAKYYGKLNEKNSERQFLDGIVMIPSFIVSISQLIAHNTDTIVRYYVHIQGRETGIREASEPQMPK